MPTINFSENSASLAIPINTYMRILKMAVDKIDEDVPDMKSAIHNGSRDKAQELSHRWKGDLANLRLDDLSKAAGILNNAVRQPAPMPEQQHCFDVFEQSFVELKRMLREKEAIS